MLPCPNFVRFEEPDRTTSELPVRSPAPSTALAPGAYTSAPPPVMLGVDAPLWSSTVVPVAALMVTPAGNAYAPLSTRVPPVTLSGPVKVFVPPRIIVPAPFLPSA